MRVRDSSWFQMGVMILLGMFLIVNELVAGEKSSGCLHLFSDTIPPERYGYKNDRGDTVIPLGKYQMCFTDTFCTYAVVLMDKVGFAGVDRKGKILFKVFPYDNGPDSPSEGMFRIVAGNKIGFADTTGKVRISAKYCAAYPFQEGLAAVGVDCRQEKQGEHSVWIGGKWGFIDAQGKVVIKPAFSGVVRGFENDTAIVELDGTRIKIDKRGVRAH